MDVERAPRRRRPWLAAGLGLGLALGCLRPQPPPDGTPEAAPPAQTPAAAPVAPETSAPAPAPPPAAADREQLPADATGNVPGGRGAPSPSAAPRKAESKSRQRSAAPRKSAAADFSAPEAELPAADELRQRLDRAYGASSPDCPSARDRKRAVCDLATQICSLTDRDPNVASVAAHCEEARRRCSNAQRRTSELCPE